MSEPGFVLVAFTTTVAVAVVVPRGLTAESWYVFVESGETVTDVPRTVPTPLSTLVELAFVATHDNTLLCPAVIVEGVAMNEVIPGSGIATVAAQVVVATVEDASVACKDMVYVPGETESVCTGVVLPFPHKKAIGETPPEDDAVHVMLEAVGEPEHDTDNALASAATNESAQSDPTSDAINARNVVLYIFISRLYYSN